MKRGIVTAEQVLEDPTAPELRWVERAIEGGNGPTGPLIVDDEENIAQALSHGLELLAVFHTGEAESGRDIHDALERTAVPRFRLPAFIAKELFGQAKRTRVFALARPPRVARLDDLADASGDIVVLDGVRLAGNIGAIVRTSYALGAAGVVAVGSGLESPWDRRIVRASRGMVFALPVVLADAAAVTEFFPAHRIPLVGLDAYATKPIQALAARPERLGLLMGSERAGASQALGGAVEQNYLIPTRPGIESLNVSVATAIALFSHRKA